MTLRCAPGHEWRTNRYARAERMVSGFGFTTYRQVLRVRGEDWTDKVLERIDGEEAVQRERLRVKRRKKGKDARIPPDPLDGLSADDKWLRSLSKSRLRALLPRPPVVEVPVPWPPKPEPIAPLEPMPRTVTPDQQAEEDAARDAVIAAANEARVWRDRLLNAQGNRRAFAHALEVGETEPRWPDSEIADVKRLLAESQELVEGAFQKYHLANAKVKDAVAARDRLAVRHDLINEEEDDGFPWLEAWPEEESSDHSPGSARVSVEAGDGGDAAADRSVHEGRVGCGV